jgi:hypothetical protein
MNVELTKKLEESEVREDAIATTLEHLKKQTWEYELKSLPSFFPFRAYKLQKDIIRLILNLKAEDKLTPKDMDEIWNLAYSYDGIQSLFCEML